MRCAIYIRVSTKLQEDRFSLGAQSSELNSYATQQGWNIIGQFKDVESGGKLNKKGLNQLLDLVEDGAIDVVLVIDQDRLSRLDTVAWEYLKSTLRENKVMIAEPGSLTDLANEDQEFISDIKNLIAKREKKAIVKRMMRGKRQMLREGRPWGKPPMGYHYNKETKEFTIDEKWSWVIPFIDNLYLEEQLGMKVIADRLNELTKTPSGRLWSENVVCQKLSTKSYHGVMEKKFSNGETISLDDMYPKLRTKETYDKIQNEREKRRTQFKVTSRRKDDLHILRRTLIQCGNCGRKIGLHQNGQQDNPVYYLRHGRKLKLSDSSLCDLTINTKRVEFNLVHAIKEILSGEDHAKKYIKLEMKKEDIQLLKNQIEQTENTITQLQEQLDKLLDLYLVGSFSKEILNQKHQKLESDLEFYKKEQKHQTAKHGALKKKEWNYEMIYDYLEIAQDFDTELTPLEKANLVGNLFPTAKLYKEKLVLIANLDVQFEVEVPIDPDTHTWHHTKTEWYKDKHKGKLK